MVPQRSLGVITTQGRYIEVYRTVGNVAYKIVSDQPSVQKITALNVAYRRFKITALNVAYRTWREKGGKDKKHSGIEDYGIGETPRTPGLPLECWDWKKTS